VACFQIEVQIRVCSFPHLLRCRLLWRFFKLYFLDLFLHPPSRRSLLFNTTDFQVIVQEELLHPHPGWLISFKENILAF
jgi:hypothetical protein